MPRLTSPALRDACRRLLRAEGTTAFLLRGSAISLVARVVGVLVSYVATVILSRSLGVRAFGAYAVALSWTLVLVFVGRAGLDRTALKFVSIYLDKADLAAVKGFIRFSTIVVFCLSAVIAVAVYVLTAVGLTSLDHDLALPAAFLIFPLAALGLNSALLRTALRIFASQFYDQILRPALLIFLLLISLAVGKAMSPAMAMTLTSLAAWGALIFSAAHLKAALQRGNGAMDYRPWRGWAGFSAPILVMAIVQELLNQINIIMLGYLHDPIGAGLYSAAWRLSSLVTFGMTAIVSMTGPLIAAAYARDDVKELSHVARVSARFGFLAALALTLPLALAGRPILQLFGPEFGRAYPALLILLVGGLGNAFTGVVGYFMTMTGRHNHALAIVSVALAINAGLNALLIPRFSVVGAATASTVSVLFWNMTMLVVVRRELGLDASALGLRLRSAASPAQTSLDDQ